MDAIAGPYAAAGLLLVVGGLAKLVSPTSLQAALRALRLPLPPFAVRVVAAAEVAVGAAALVWASRLVAAAVAVSYLVFTGLVLVLRRRGGPLSSCGCFGRRDVPPTRGHAVVTGSLAAVAAVAVVRPLAPVTVGGTVEEAVALAATTACLTGLLYAALAVLPLISPAARVAR